MSALRTMLAAAGFACAPLAAAAAALTDGSAGAVQALSGAFTVPQSLGTVRGANLFHSFTRFGVAAGESATFTTTDAGLRHVISRVTGGEASLINGPVKLQAASGSKPSFWLVNPSGIVIGEGGAFDVPGSLHVSTAPQLRFADGSVWSTGGSTPSTLSAAAPEAFGFVGSQPAAALRWRDGGVLLQPGSTLELSAGEIAIERASLVVPGGTVRVRAAGAVSLREGSLIGVTADAEQPRSGLSVDAGTLDLAASGLVSAVLDGAAAGSGGIDVRVAGALTMREGAEITSRTASPLPAGPVRVSAGSLSLRDRGNGNGTGIASLNFGNGAGAPIAVEVAGAADFRNGGNLFASNNLAGAGGAITLDAGSLRVDGGGSFAIIGTQAFAGSADSGAVTVRVRGEARFVNGGQVASATAGTGAAGRLSVSANSLRVDASDDFPLSGVQTFGYLGAPGAIAVDVTGAIEALGGGGIGSLNRGDAAPGAISVRAGSVHLVGGSSSIGALTRGAGPAAAVEVEVAGRLRLEAGGQVSSTSWGVGDAAGVRVRAATAELIGSADAATGISSGSIDVGNGSAGPVTVDVGRLLVTSRATIGADSVSERGNGGDVTVRADQIVLDGEGSSGGIRSFVFAGEGNVKAGRVSVESRGELTIKAGGGIVAGTLGPGGAGSIDVKAGTLTIDGTGAPTVPTGIGGDAASFQGRVSGAAAPVTIAARRLEVHEGGTITSSTATGAAASFVRIDVGELLVDGGGKQLTYTGIGVDSSGAGAGGSIAIKADRVSIVKEGQISSSAFDSGRGGSITIEARELRLDQTGGIISVAAGSGDAGSLDLRVSEALTIGPGSGIVANTGGAGNAGRIQVSAGSLEIAGIDPASDLPGRIASRARAEASGQPGSISVDVKGTLTMQPGSLMTIANDTRVANPGAATPSLLSVRAAEIVLDSAEITAAASLNANAGRIAITTPGRLTLTHSSLVRTTAVDGDGGPITVVAGDRVRLADSQITTSVEGRSNGNGGDISLTAPTLLLASGFVQANTAAPRSRGGNVTIAVDQLVPDGSSVFIGGNRIAAVRTGVAGFNVIQAAAPEGLSGALDVTIPELNLAGTLVGLSTTRIDFGPLGRDLCEVGGESSLTVLGRGAIRPSAAGPVSIDPRGSRSGPPGRERSPSAAPTRRSGP